MRDEAAHPPRRAGTAVLPTPPAGLASLALLLGSATFLALGAYLVLSALA